MVTGTAAAISKKKVIAINFLFLISDKFIRTDTLRISDSINNYSTKSIIPPAMASRIMPAIPTVNAMPPGFAIVGVGVGVSDILYTGVGV